MSFLQKNFILSHLHVLQPDFLAGRAKHIEFRHGERIRHSGEEITDVFFPTTGVMSIVAELPEGDVIETAMVGCDGAIGGIALLGGRVQVGTTFGQMPGEGFSVDVCDLSTLVRHDPEVRSLFARNEQFVTAQAQQTAACNARHSIPERFAGWILRASDAVRSHDLQMTQEFIAEMLGVQRASVSGVANGLLQDGLISYRRGRIRIMDRPALQHRACQCYRSLCSMRHRIFDLPEVAAEAAE